MAEHDRKPQMLTSVEKSLNIIEALWKLNGAGVTELADQFGIAKSTIYSHLTTLEQKGYVVNEEDVYRLSLRFLTLGEHAKRSQALYGVAKPSMEELAEETGEQVFCMVEQHGLATTICTSEGRRSIRTNITTGTHSYMHCSAAGKAILAHLPERRVDEIIDRWGLQRFTENTITDRGQLLDELAAGRERGFVFNREEYRKGVTAIGVPIIDDGGTINGSITITGPTTRLEKDEHEGGFIDPLLATANTIEVNMNVN